jgi:NAD(P)-dependent dehydrogenase (short-subunit alcohol dehydrogenase family)
MKKTILITGAAGNLGGAVVKRLTGEGRDLLATVHSANEVKSLQGERIKAHALDLTDEAAVKTFVEEQSSRVDIEAAILLAGGFRPGSLLKTDGAAIKKMFAINFETAFYLVRELLPVFEERGGGQFVLVGARPGLDPKAGKDLAAYAFSKTLVFKLAEFINAYGQDKRINATVIVPSVIDTPPNREAMPDADFSKWATPEAIADAIAFTLSDSGRQMKESILKMYNES